MKVDKITFGAGEDVVKSMTLISSADMDLTAYVVGMGCSEATFQLESIGGNVKYNDILRRDVLLEKDEVKDESMRNMPLELRAVFGPAAALMEETTLLHAFRDLIRNS